MSRKPREATDFPGAVYHIVSRGIMNRRIFRCVQDYKKFLAILREAKKKFDFYLYSYNLIPIYAQKDYDDDLIDRERFLRYGGEGTLEKLRVGYLKFVTEESKNPKRPKFIKSQKFI